MSRLVSPPLRRKYARYREEGYSRAEACRMVGVSTRWAYDYDRGLKDTMRGGAHPTGGARKQSTDPNNPYVTVRGEIPEYPPPIPKESLGEEALAALDDIGLFARRYFGLVLQPFQLYLTEKMVELAATPEKEYVVINQAPGTGKSTFYALVLPAWLTARDRTTKGLIISATDTQAKWYVAKLKDALENPYSVTADPEDLEAGLAFDAQASLLADYGRFKPEVRTQRWASDAFYVELPEGISTIDKEPTWSAFGRSSGFLGLRVGYALADDVFDPEKNRTAESRDDLKRWWSDVAEKRLEPGGLLVLQMQRLDPDDICAYALNMGGTVIREGDETPRKYHHFKFKAHYPEWCKEDHGPDAKPYDPAAPDAGGCLLYPKRLPYAEILSEAENNPNFEMVFQQEEVATKKSLVNRLWINGGTDPETREYYPGCMDAHRDVAEIPKGLDGHLLSVVTADPSPTQFWAVIWWLVRVDLAKMEPIERYVLDIYRHKMNAPDFLDWNHDTSQFSGLMPEWHQRAKDLGQPVTHWIVEQNAAQRFMLQYEHVNRWMRASGATILGHETHKNKADKELGIWTIGAHYKHGRVRLPGRRDTEARSVSQKLVDEVCRYPGGRTDDVVMAHWFLEWWLPYLTNDIASDEYADDHQWRPSFLAGVE